MIVGYARTSTVEQEAGFEAQLKQLKAAGCEKVFSEQVSAVAATRAVMAAGPARDPRTGADQATSRRRRHASAGPFRAGA
jgi:hypothetical protein